MEFILFMGLILGWIHFNGRISRLEDRLRGSTGDSAPLGALRPIPAPSVPRTSPTTEEALAEIEKLHQRENPHLSGVVDWLAKDFMVKLGAFLLLLAVGWFVSYAITEEWIGPAGQITLGLLLGVVFVALGVWRIQNERHQGGIFTVLGATIVLLTLLAAREIYHFFTPGSALLVMLLTIVFVAFVSVRYQSERLAFSGLLLASIAPFFTAAMPMPALELFTYLLVVVLGTLWVVWVSGWTKLTLTSLIVTYLYSIGYIQQFGRPTVDEDTTLIFTFIFVSLYFAANMISLIRRHGMGKHHMPVHTLTALGTAIYLLTWIEVAVLPEWKSLLYVAWALVFALGTYVVFMYTANRSAFYLYGATSAALLGAATAALLDGPVLTIAYLLEVGLIIAVAARLGMALETMTRISWLLVVPILLSLDSLNEWQWGLSIFNEHFVVVALTMGTLFMTAHFLRAQANEKEVTETVSHTAVIFTVLGGMYAVALVWLTTHVVLVDDVATTLSLIVYTLAGISFYVSGTREGNSAFRITGAVLVGIVVLRLLFVEVWNMALEGRIVTFLIIGALLISTAFIKKQLPTQE